MTQVEIPRNRIPAIWRSANSFASVFASLFADVDGQTTDIAEKNIDSFNDDVDQHSVLAANGLFAVELYLKLLLVHDCNTSGNGEPRIRKSHDLFTLFKELSSSRQNEIVSGVTQQGGCIDKNDFVRKLSAIKNGFAKWRYSFEEDVNSEIKLSISFSLRLIQELKKTATSIAKNHSGDDDSPKKSITMGIGDFEIAKSLIEK